MTSLYLCFIVILQLYTCNKVVVLAQDCDYDVILTQSDYLISEDNISLVCEYNNADVSDVLWETRQTQNDAYELAYTGYPAAPEISTPGPGYSGRVGQYIDDPAASHSLILIDKALYIDKSQWKCTATTNCLVDNELEVHFRSKC